MKLVKTVMIVSLLLIASLAWAKGPGKVSNGPHNLSVTGVDQIAGTPGSSLYRTTDVGTNEICVFCHTPHGGSLTGPLWNRTNPNPAAWQHYNSATITINKTANPLNRTPNDESLLCLSCHDGSVSVNHVINLPNGQGPFQTLIGGGFDTEIIDDFINGVPGNRIGGSIADTMDTGDLSDDHPISFSYDQVFADYNAGPKNGQLYDPGVAETKGVRFFGASGNYVECSSCHDPHVNYLDNPAYTPFLITSNTGSALCLACHNK